VPEKRDESKVIVSPIADAATASRKVVTPSDPSVTSVKEVTVIVAALAGLDFRATGATATSELAPRIAITRRVRRKLDALNISTNITVLDS
jgi:hypothetical protein